jgi:hypothetical protein
VVELALQRGQLNRHRVFNHRWLVQLGVGEDGAQPVDVTLQVSAAVGLEQQPTQPRGASPPRARSCGVRLCWQGATAR